MSVPQAANRVASGGGGANTPEQSTAAISVLESLSPPMMIIAAIFSFLFWRCFQLSGTGMRYWNMSSYISGN